MVNFRMPDNRTVDQVKRDAAGFWGSASTGETFYNTPAGRVWLVGSEDELPEPREVFAVPGDIKRIDELVGPEEAIEWCQQIQDISGEILLSE